MKSDFFQWSVDCTVCAYKQVIRDLERWKKERERQRDRENEKKKEREREKKNFGKRERDFLKMKYLNTLDLT